MFITFSEKAIINTSEISHALKIDARDEFYIKLVMKTGEEITRKFESELDRDKSFDDLLKIL